MSVPLHFIGEEQAPGVKQDKGLVSHLLTSVEVRCLPADLPEYIAVDLSTLVLDATIHLSQLQVPPGVDLLALTQGDDRPVVSIHTPRAAVEMAEVTLLSAEVPAIHGQTHQESTRDSGQKK